MARCWWGAADPLYRRYHDREWGRPVKDDRRLFEKICLEGFQSGLSWITILRKRENFRKAFDDFEIETVARFNASTGGDPDAAMPGSCATGPRSWRPSTTPAAASSFRRRKAWLPTPGRSSRHPEPGPQVTAGPAAVAMSKDLKQRGWAFVGPTTIHSFMQAVGIINDHLRGCQTREEVERLLAKFVRPG